MRLYPLSNVYYKELFEIAKCAEPFGDINLYQYTANMDKREGYVLITREGKIAGCVSFSDFVPGVNIVIHCMVDPEYHKRWVTREILKTLANYVYEELGLPRMSGFSIKGRTDEAGEFLLKLGFKREGCIRQGINIKSNYYDLMLFGLLKEDCKWL